MIIHGHDNLQRQMPNVHLNLLPLKDAKLAVRPPTLGHYTGRDSLYTMLILLDFYSFIL